MTRPERRELIYKAVDAERERQRKKFGGNLHQDNIVWVAALAEELGEVSRASLDMDAVFLGLNPDGDVEEMFLHLVAEIDQVIALGVAWRESLMDI